MKWAIIGSLIFWLLVATGVYLALHQPNVYDGHVTPKHRLLHQIDIQGHMEYGPRRPCPAVYDAPDGNLRECL